MTASQCAGLSGFRTHWDQPIAVVEDGQRLLKDSVVKDRGQTAVWGSERAGPLAFDAVHRRLLVRFPEAAEKIATALAAGQTVEKVELVLPYLAWVDWVHGQPPHFWEGHLTGADNIVRWYNYRDAMPAPMQDSIIRCWTAWLMPDRETELDPTLRRRYDNTSGKLARLAGAASGFVVEMGDQKEYGSFEKFQTQVRQTKLAAGAKGAVTYPKDEELAARLSAASVRTWRTK